MFYDFAHDLTLDEVRGVVAEHNAALGTNVFIEADRGDYVIFNYVIQFEGAWLPFTGDAEQDRKAAILRELRGITFDKASGLVALRKLHKFFNSGQNEETRPELIDWNQPHDILLKADGSMLCPYLHRDGEWEWHSKMGATDMTQPVMEFVAKHPKYNLFAEHCCTKGITPIFEWVSRQQRIVIDYPVDDLILLAARVIATGQYVDFNTLSLMANDFGITIIERVEGSVNDIEVFTAATRALKGQEGYVIRFHNGHMVKIKADEYCLLHNSKEQLNLEKNALAMILSDEIDDLLPQLDAGDRDAVTAFSNAVFAGMAATARDCEDLRDRLLREVDNQADVRERKKQYAAAVMAGAEVMASAEMKPYIKGLMFRGFDIDDLLPEIRKIVAGSCGTQTRVDEARVLFGGVKWSDYRGQFDGDV